MTPETSPAAVALRAPASLYTGLPAAGGLPARDTARERARDGAGAIAGAYHHRGLRRLGSALGDAAGIIAVAYAFPLVILAVGIPIALLVRLAMWLVGAL